MIEITKPTGVEESVSGSGDRTIVHEVMLKTRAFACLPASTKYAMMNVRVSALDAECFAVLLSTGAARQFVKSAEAL